MLYQVGWLLAYPWTLGSPWRLTWSDLAFRLAKKFTRPKPLTV